MTKKKTEKLVRISDHVQLSARLPVREIAILRHIHPSLDDITHVLRYAVHGAALEAVPNINVWPDVSTAILYLEEDSFTHNKELQANAAKLKDKAIEQRQSIRELMHEVYSKMTLMGMYREI